jgi:hypothetical protein
MDLSLLQKPIHYKGGGGEQKSFPLLFMRALAQLLPPGLIQKALDRGAQADVRGSARCASQVLDRSAQAYARGATDVPGRGVQAVARGAARCALYVHGLCAKIDAFGRSFAVLSTQVSTVGLRLRYNRMASGSMLEVSRDAVAEREEQLVSCTAERSKYCSICTVTLDPCGDSPFTSWGRWQCFRCGADAGLNSCYATCGCGT